MAKCSDGAGESSRGLGVLAFLDRLKPAVVVRPPQRHTPHDQQPPEQKPQRGNLHGGGEEHVGNVLHVGHDFIVPVMGRQTTRRFVKRQLRGRGKGRAS